jgi:hypothetical protein
MRADAEKAARPTATLDQVIARRHAVHARGMVEATQLPAAHIDAWRRRSWRQPPALSSPRASGRASHPGGSASAPDQARPG